ncbi:MAG: peptidylprolyl isomerase [Candidatus Binatia bacterium]
MLESLRRYSNSTGVKILYGLLAALFVLWGVGAVGGDRVDVIAKVYDRQIKRTDLTRATESLQRRYDALFKGRVQLPAMDLRSRALDDLIDEALLRHEAARLGLDVTDSELVAAITTMPELQENGRFSRELLERILASQRDRGEFEENVRRGLLLERLQALVTDGIQVSAAEVEERYRLDHEQANLSFVRVSAVELAATVTPTDADLAKTLEAHGDRYRVAERVRARYVAYRRADFAEQAPVSEQEIADFYDEHRDDRFAEPEQVRARHILVKVAPTATDATRAEAKKKAEELLAKVQAGADFADLAKKSSDDPGSAAKGGDLGFFPRGRMVPGFDTVAFALDPGKVSDVVETPFGFHVIKVEEHRQGGAKPLEAVRDEILKALRDDKGFELARAQAEADRRQIARGKSFAEAVGGRRIDETAPFAKGDPIPGLGPVTGFAEAAFGLGAGEVSDLVETEDTVYLLTPFDRREAHASALEDVRERLVADTQRERGEALARERAETLRTKAAAVGLDKAAAEMRLTVAESGNFDRRAPSIPKIGAAPDLRTDAFVLTPEAPLAPKVYAVGGDAVVAALKQRTQADMADFPSAKDGLRDSLLQQKRAGLLQAYMDFLKERAQRDGALEVRQDVLARG